MQQIQEKMLSTDKDPMGLAIRDFWKEKKEMQINVFSDIVDDDVIPVSYLFRDKAVWPKIEKEAVRLARGKTLDVGAGTGVHSLVLEEKGLSVTALEWSPLACDVMRQRGLKDVHCTDVFQYSTNEKYDTILLLMNGIGLAGTLENLKLVFQLLKTWLREGGQILLDSSDVRFLFEESDGSMYIDLNGSYYGEMSFEMEYKGVKGDRFPWVYVAFDILKMHAEESGLQCELLCEGEHYDYLARLTPLNDD